MEIRPIARIKNDYDDKFGVPRQSGIADGISYIVFEKEYCDESCIKEIDGFSHLWLIWEFDKNDHESKSLTVRPPRLGGNKRVGVFASRSPYRPNLLGLSSVRLLEVKKDNDRLCLVVSGADMVNGTPIYDIKPYIRFSDSHEDAISGYVDTEEFNILDVEISPSLINKIDKSKRNNLIEMLKNDPRPAYKHNDESEYGFKYAGFEIKFFVKDKTLTVTDIDND